MAKMIPDVDPDTIADPAEAVVYRQLRDRLPRSWTVRHSFAFCWMEHGTLHDSEVDFIVIAPGHGVMVVEVKGSHGFACRSGKWHKVNKDGSEEKARDPFQQAKVAKHRLVDRVALKVFSRSKSGFPGTFGHLVVYPFGKVQGPLPTSAEPVLMVAYADMPRIAERIAEAYAAWGSRTGGAAFTPEVASRVASFFAEESTLVPVLAADLDEDDRKIEALTLLQYGAFRGILGNHRAHVRGPAGSGKTLLAGWAARELAAQGLRVLFLCYNRVLAVWLPWPGEDPAPFETRSFFSVCHDLVRRAGIPFDPPEDDAHDFWTRVAPAKMCEALEALPEGAYGRYDAVVVDEGQDFHRDWWLPVQLLLKDPDKGRLLIFSDPEQTGVYGRSQSVPSPLVSFDLREPDGKA